MWGFIRFGCNTLWLGGGGKLQNKTHLWSSQWKVSHRGCIDILFMSSLCNLLVLNRYVQLKNTEVWMLAHRWQFCEENCRSMIHLHNYFFGDWQWCEIFRLPLSHWSQAMLRIKKGSLYFTQTQTYMYPQMEIVFCIFTIFASKACAHTHAYTCIYACK